MKLLNILLLSLLGYTNAQGIIPFVYNIFSKAALNNPIALNGLTNSSDPLSVDMAEEVTVGVFDLNSCENTTVIVTFLVSDIVGLSTYELDEVKMISYGFQGCSIFEVSGTFDTLEASYSGFVEGDGCDEPSFSNSFSGTATITNPAITYIASKTSGGIRPEAIDSAEVTELSVTFSEIEVNMDTDPALFTSILAEVKDAIAEGMEDALNSTVDASIVTSNLPDVFM